MDKLYNIFFYYMYNCIIGRYFTKNNPRSTLLFNTKNYSNKNIKFYVSKTNNSNNSVVLLNNIFQHVIMISYCQPLITRK